MNYEAEEGSGEGDRTENERDKAKRGEGQRQREEGIKETGERGRSDEWGYEKGRGGRRKMQE